MSTRWSPFTKHLFIICCLAASVWLVFRLRILWTPLLLVFILSFLASFPVNGILRRTGWPRKLVVVIVYLLLLIVIGVAVAGVLPQVVLLGSGLAGTFTRGAASVWHAPRLSRSSWPPTSSWIWANCIDRSAKR